MQSWNLSRLELHTTHCTFTIYDQNIVHGIEEFGPGRRYDINKEEEIEIEIVGELVEIDMEVRGDKRMFEIVREVGDSLGPGGYDQDQIDSRLPIKSPRGESPNFRHHLISSILLVKHYSECIALIFLQERAQ